MFFKVILASCLVGVALCVTYHESNAEIQAWDSSPLDWCACNANVDVAKAKYEKLYDAYFEMANAFINGTINMIQSKVDQMNRKYLGADLYQLDSYEMVYLLFDLCHVPTLKHDFKPIWRQNPDMSAEQVCTWLSTWGRIAENRIPYNWALIKSCAYERLFEDVILLNYREHSGEDKCSK